MKWYDVIKPLDPPLANEPGQNWPSLDALWSQAKFLFARIAHQLALLGGPTPVASRILRRGDVRDILNWLEPVERLVRGCLVMRAIDWLRTTAEGLKLVAANTRPAAASERTHRPTDAAEQTATDQPATAASETPTASSAPAFNAKAWIREGWVYEPVDPDAAITPRKSPPPRKASAHTRGQRLAARIALVSSLLDDPAHAIRSIARALARLTPQRLNPWSHGFIPTRREWMHGRDSVKAARNRLFDMLVAHVEPRPG